MIYRAIRRPRAHNPLPRFPFYEFPFYLRSWRKSAKYFRKVPGPKYFRLCGPHGLYLSCLESAVVAQMQSEAICWWTSMAVAQ